MSTKGNKRPGANDVAPPAPDAETLTIGEVAYLLRVSPTSVRRIVEKGQISSIAVLGRMLISRDAVRRFLLQAEVTKAPTKEAVAALAAEDRIRREQRARVRVSADWNTGRDTFGIDEEPKIRPKKINPAGGAQ